MSSAIASEQKYAVLDAACTDVFQADSGAHLNRSVKNESLLAFIARSIGELRSFKFALGSFVVNNLRRRYRRSVLGFAWSLLNPLLTMLVMTAVFSMLLKYDPLNFGILLFTGLLPWSFITDSLTNGAQSIVGYEAFLKKVYVPKLFFPLVSVSTELMNFLFSLMSLMIVALCVGLHITPALCLLPLAIAVLFVFNFSAAIILAIATVYFRDMNHIIRVVLNFLFYLMPIIYTLEAIPASHRWLFKLNPMYHFLNPMRVIIYDGHCPDYLEWSIPVALTAVCFTLAMYTLKRTEHDLIYRL